MLVDKCAWLDVNWLYEILMFEVWRFIKMQGLKHRKPIHSGLFWKEHVEGKISFISDRNALNGHSQGSVLEMSVEHLTHIK